MGKDHNTPKAHSSILNTLNNSKAIRFSKQENLPIAIPAIFLESAYMLVGVQMKWHFSISLSDYYVIYWSNSLEGQLGVYHMSCHRSCDLILVKSKSVVVCFRVLWSFLLSLSY